MTESLVTFRPSDLYFGLI